MPNEEIVVTEPESTVVTEPETVGDEEKTATDELKEGLTKLEEETPGETIPEVEGEETPKVEEKPEETEEIDEVEVLKRAGFTQKSLDDIKADLDLAGNQAQTWNWANKHIPGFADFVTQQMEKARGNAATGAETLDDFGKTLEDKKPSVDESSLIEKGYSQEQIDNFKNLASALGFVQRDEIKADKQAETDEKVRGEATQTFQDFGKSEQVVEQLKALGLDWDKDVKVSVTKLLTDGFGISDFGHVNLENITRAFNAFIMEKDGGIEQILNTVKSKAVDKHKEKLKLGKVLPDTGAVTPSAPADLESWLNDPNTKADDIKKKMKELDKRR